MGAYNWISVTDRCPACHRDATIRCQTHVASSYDGSTGRFMNREYRLGEKMRWWEETHPDYATWRVMGHRSPRPDSSHDEEACYSECTLCGARLYVVLRFHEASPIAVLGVGLEDEWPSDYWK